MAHWPDAANRQRRSRRAHASQQEHACAPPAAAVRAWRASIERRDTRPTNPNPAQPKKKPMTESASCPRFLPKLAPYAAVLAHSQLLKPSGEAWAPRRCPQPASALCSMTLLLTSSALGLHCPGPIGGDVTTADTTSLSAWQLVQDQPTTGTCEWKIEGAGLERAHQVSFVPCTAETSNAFVRSFPALQKPLTRGATIRTTIPSPAAMRSSLDASSPSLSWRSAPSAPVHYCTAKIPHPPHRQYV